MKANVKVCGLFALLVGTVIYGVAAPVKTPLLGQVRQP
jgi:hypothetical protein